MATTLVIPTCRPDSLADFAQAWRGKGGWDNVIVVEDAPQRSNGVRMVVERLFPAGSKHVSHAEIDKALGDDAWIISRRDSAIRCYGFLQAYQQGMDVLTLDDDCYPTEGTTDLVEAHSLACHHPRWLPSIPGMRTRGLPYRNQGIMRAVANMGLWTNNPDLDGAQGLLNPMSGFVPPLGNRIVPAWQYIPVCGMNLFIRHAALPLFYFPLMGEGQPYRRFDDIWAGVLAKRAMDVLGWSLSVGEPFVEHRRASDPFANLVKEAPGIQANETFWGDVDRVPVSRTEKMTAVDVVEQLSYGLSQRLDPYLRRLGEALGVWARHYQQPLKEKIP